MPSISTLLRWLRAPLAPTAACDAIACTLLAIGESRRDWAEVHAGGGAYSDGPLVAPWPSVMDWAALAATSLLIYGFGMGLNDWADRRRDLRIAPTRPIPSGRLAPAVALGIALLLGSAALWVGAGGWRSRPAVVAALGAAAAYDLLLKRWLVPGALAMGAARAANAMIGVAPLVFLGRGRYSALWPLWAPLCVGLYSAAVNVLSTTEEVDSPTRRAVARGMAALAFAGAAALAMHAAGRLTLGALLAAGTVLSLLFGRVPRPGPPKRQVLEMLLGLYLLAAVIAGGCGSLLVEGAAFVVAFALVYATQIAIRALARAAAREA